MTGDRVLVVEDDATLAAGIVRGLKVHGFEVELSSSVADATQRALRDKPTVIVLDLMLPDGSGLELLRALEQRGGSRVIVLTARTGLDDRLQSFALGAVDYLAKPFWMEELVARIRARVPSPAAPHEVVQLGRFSIDFSARVVSLDEAQVALTRTEFDLLSHLVRRSDHALTRAQLAAHALSGQDVEPRTIDAHIAKLRKKLGPAGAAIVAVWGIGYRFDARGTR